MKKKTKKRKFNSLQKDIRIQSKLLQRLLWSNIFAVDKKFAWVCFAIRLVPSISSFFEFFICCSVARIGPSECSGRLGNLDDLLGVYVHCPLQALYQSTWVPALIGRGLNILGWPNVAFCGIQFSRRVDLSLVSLPEIGK